MGHDINAAQARAISNLARKHKDEMLDLQERHFTEMQALEVELFGHTKTTAPSTYDYRFTVSEPSGATFCVHTLEQLRTHLPDKQRQELFDAVACGCAYFDSIGRCWKRTA